MSLPFKQLALSGGGMKGILHVGVLNALSKHQSLVFPDGVYGCSIGSIIATLIAFELPLKTEIITKYMKYDNVVPKINFTDVANAFKVKGLFTMDLFEKEMIKAFGEYDIDITSLKLKDAKMPLFIVASNITKGVPTLLSDDVFVLDALKCSCCLPGVFQPQELYGQLYVDGGLFAPSLEIFAPNALNLFLTKKRNKQLTKETLADISSIDFIRQLYSMSMNQFHKFNKTENTLDLEYPNLNSDSNLNEFNLDDMMNYCEKVLDTFLLSKSRRQESLE
jgi:predicted acylesterase/phospholipase RssA